MIQVVIRFSCTVYMFLKLVVCVTRVQLQFIKDYAVLQLILPL